MDGLRHLLLRTAGMRQSPRWEVPWLAARSSSSPSMAPKANLSPLTQSRQRGETILLTYGNEDWRGKADNGETAWANLGDGVGILWWSSGPEDGFSGEGNDRWSSSKQKLSAGHSGEAEQWWRLCSVHTMGKNYRGDHLRFLYRGESLGEHGEIPQIHPSTELKIAPKFVTDLVHDANSQWPGDKALGTARSVGVLDDHENMSQCRIQMVEWHGARAKMAADGGRQATSRGWVRMALRYAGVNPK
jgi:hypothetical protein